MWVVMVLGAILIGGSVIAFLAWLLGKITGISFTKAIGYMLNFPE